MMAPIDWSDRITQLNKGISGIPKDMKFKIVETKTGLVQEVEAHRMVLAMASDVFHTMFYGSGNIYQDVKEGEVVIKDTTKEAFEIMIGAVYNTVSMEESLKDKSVEEVFTVLNLVTRYNIPELHNSLTDYLASFPLTEETVLDVAQDSMKYSETFTDDVKELQMCCARYLKPKFQDVSSLIQFHKDNKDQKDMVHQLLILGSKSLKVFYPSCSGLALCLATEGRW